jgi:ABC-2 type transport system permease protein
VSTLKETPDVLPRRQPHRGRFARIAPVRPHVAWAIFARNFQGYFSSPAGYVFITLFVVVASWAEFWQPVFFTENLANLDPLNAWMPYILLVFVPAITMSIWAEERKQGTDELLLTLPARAVEDVLGKYAAPAGIYTVALAFLAVGHVPLLKSLGRPDLGVLAATYLGDWLMGAMLLAVGMVASVLSTNVTVAFILGALFCAVPVFAGWLGPALQMLASLGELPGLGWARVDPQAIASGGATRWAEALSVPGQFREFGTGVVPLSGVLYFVALAGSMLYLNVVLIGRRHWAGGQGRVGRWLHATVRVVALVVAFVSLDVLVLRWLNVRVDATEGRLHTLSPISRRVVREIPPDRPVYIHAYISPDVPREYVEVRTNLVNTLH